MSENEIRSIQYENFNQKVLVNGGVCATFLNVFASNGNDKLPTIKSKLRKILVDFGMYQTCLEINQQLGIIQIWYRDEQSAELKGNLLQRFNRDKNNQTIELNIEIEGNSCSAPKVSRPVRTYNGLTKLLFQEFIQSTKSVSMIDDNPYNQMKTIIQKGNLAASEPLQAIFQAIFGEEVD